MDEIKKDKRFVHVLTDPKYFKLKRQDRKVKIDNRFKGMFTDKKFKLNYSVDKKGRPLKTTTSTDLKKYYDISDNDESDDSKSEDEIEDKKQVELDSRWHMDTKDNDEEDDDDIDDNNEDDDLNTSFKKINSTKKIEKKVEMSEGEKEEFELDEDDSEDDSEDDDGDDAGDTDKDDVNQDGDSSSTSSSSDDDDDEVDFIKPKLDDSISHPWGELDHEAPTTDEVTRRLAICNMDWDRIKAIDLLVLFNSFKPENGVIKSVSIYPSEFGLERMKEEEMKGPKELTDKSDEKLIDDNEKYFQEKLRKYQLNRLKYYYAVMECDTPSTADVIYNNCNGLEYESSATVLDLRFIPDDMTFDHDFTSEATLLPPNGSYKPTIFVNTALHQSNVQLTWDETPVDRLALTMRDFTKSELDDKEVEHFLASASEEEDDEDAGDSDGDGEDGDENDNDNNEKMGGNEDDDGNENCALKNEVKSDNLNKKRKLADLEESITTITTRKKLKSKNKNTGDNLKSQIEKYKSLLSELNDNENKKDGEDDDDDDIDMEVTWEPGLKGAAEELVKRKQRSNLTPWEQYLEKKKDRIKLKKQMKKNPNPKQEDSGDDDYEVDEREEMEGSTEKIKNKKFKSKKTKCDELTESQKADLELLVMDENNLSKFISKNDAESDKRLTKKQKLKQKILEKKKAKDSSQSKIVDSRFTQMYSDPNFTLDPSANEFAKKKKKQKIK